MSICVLVFQNLPEARGFQEELEKNKTLISSSQIVYPEPKTQEITKEINNLKTPTNQIQQKYFELIAFKDVKLFNPKLTQKDRQKTLSLWLMPFGFLSGISFSQMTQLKTFSEIILFISFWCFQYHCSKEIDSCTVVR